MSQTEILDTTVLETSVSAVVDGKLLSEQVSLSLRDFAMDSIQTLAYLEETDPELYEKFRSGNVTAEDLSGSAVRLRGYLYAIIKAKVKDRRLRDVLAVGDFDLAAGELAAIVGAVEDLNVDLNG